MIGLDTNVVLRYLLQDDAAQSSMVNLNSWSGCIYTLGFDRRAAKLPNFKLPA